MIHKKKFSFSFLLALYLMIPSLSLGAVSNLAPFEATANEIVSGLNARDSKPFNRIIDSDAILDKAFDGLQDTDMQVTKVRGTFKNAIESKAGDKIVAMLPEHGYAKLIRVKNSGEITKALIRLDLGDSGLGYLDLHMKRTSGGKIRVVDWYNYGLGQQYSQTLRQIIILMSPNPSLLGRIFDRFSNRNEDMKSIGELFSLANNKKYHEAALKFFTLSEELRKNEMLAIIGVQIATQSNDENLYKKSLANLAKYHGDNPALTFLLIDHYYFTHNYDALNKAVSGLQTSFEVEDAALIALKANVLLAQNKYAEAATEARHAIAIEPAYESSQWSLLKALSLSKKYNEAVQTAKNLEKNFGYDLSPANLASQSDYEGLVKSNEYRSWKGLR